MKMEVFSDDKSAGPLRGVVAAEERGSVATRAFLLWPSVEGLRPILALSTT